MAALGIRRGALRNGVLALFALGLSIVAGPALASKYSSIVIEYETGRILHAVDPDQQSYPASLTKMMTLYLTFEALTQRRANLEQRLTVSEHAAAMEPSKLGLRPGTSIRLEDALLGLVTLSANDAAVVLGEALGGSEPNFARIMTMKARALGMTRTTFANASGLPNPDQVSTARDMALLGRALIRDFPRYYPYFNTRSFTYNGRVIGNHNHLLDNYEGADGIKTGFIRASGFNLVASAKRDNRRLIGVVFGGQSVGWRDAHMVRLLDRGFGMPSRGEDVLVARAPAQADEDEDGAARTPVSRVVASTLKARFHPQGDAEESPVRRAARERVEAPVEIASLPPAKGFASTPGKAPGETPPGKAVVVQPAAAAMPPAPPHPSGWGIQIGAFGTEKSAWGALDKARRDAKLKHGINLVTAATQARGRAPVWRARIGGLAEAQATQACKTLVREKLTCIPLSPATLAN